MEQWGYPKLNQKKSKNTFSKRGKGGHPSSGNVRQTVLNRLPPQRDWLKYIQFFGVSHEKTKPTHFGIEPSAKSIFSYLRIIQSHDVSIVLLWYLPSSPATPLNVSKTICNFQPIHGQTWTRWTVKCWHLFLQYLNGRHLKQKLGTENETMTEQITFNCEKAYVFPTSTRSPQDPYNSVLLPSWNSFFSILISRRLFTENG